MNTTEMLRSSRSSVLAFRRMIAEAVGTADAAQLDSLVLSLAAAEGRVYLLTTVDSIMTADTLTPEQARERAISYVYSTLSQGADDQWSGNGNECKRARFEGIRRAADELRFGPLGVN